MAEGDKTHSFFKDALQNDMSAERFSFGREKQKNIFIFNIVLLYLVMIIYGMEKLNGYILGTPDLK